MGDDQKRRLCEFLLRYPQPAVQGLYGAQDDARAWLLANGYEPPPLGEPTLDPPWHELDDGEGPA